MKNILTMLLFAITLNIAAQSEEKARTLAGDSKLHLGYFISPSVQVGTLAGTTSVIAGIGAGVIFSDNISLDLMYRQIITENTPKGEADSRLYLDGKWALLRCEFAVKPQKTVHLNFPLILGFGDIEMDKKDSFESDPISIPQGDALFATLEPGIALEINVIKYLKLNISAGYRFVSNVAFRNLTEKDLMGPTFSATLKIGIF